MPIYKKQKNNHTTGPFPKALTTKVLQSGDFNVTMAASATDLQHFAIKMNSYDDPTVTGSTFCYGRTELNNLYNDYVVKKCKVTFSYSDITINDLMVFIYTDNQAGIAATLREQLYTQPGVVYKQLFWEARAGQNNPERTISLSRDMATVLGHGLNSLNEAAVGSDPTEIAYMHIVFAQAQPHAAAAIIYFNLKFKQDIRFMAKNALVAAQ